MVNQQLEGIKVNQEVFSNIIKNRGINKTIQDHYKRLSEELQDQDEYLSEMVNKKYDRLHDCNKIWSLDWYKNQKIKDIIGTCLCRDKFCSNCKILKQTTRLARFVPEVDKYKDKLYQIVLTCPNLDAPTPGELRKYIKKQFKAWFYITRYLRGTKKIKGIDFMDYGQYLGAIRTLEVTYNGDSYHPHIHILAAIQDTAFGDRAIFNKYSIDHKGRRGDRLFTEFEVLLQNIFYLIMNDMEVTKKALKKLKEGYSCICEPVKEGDYLDNFKYLVKSFDQRASPINYDQFKTLYFALNNVRQIQGYGCFFRIKDTDDFITEEIDHIYDDLIKLLKLIEVPEAIGQSVQDLGRDNDNLIISRKKFYSIYKSILSEDTEKNN